MVDQPFKGIEKKEGTELRLCIYPEPFLRFRATEPFNEEQVKSELVRNTVKAMMKTMYKYQGVGLAAQQVGVPQPVFVMDPNWHQTKRKRPHYFLNPSIVEFDEKAGALEVRSPGEGCLSLPYGYKQPVPRAARLKLKWQRLDASWHEAWFEGMESIIIQHEMDHLAGVLFVDRLSRLKKDMFIRRVRKVRRQYKKGFKRGLAQMKNAPRTREFALNRAIEWETEQKSKREWGSENAQKQASDALFNATTEELSEAARKEALKELSEIGQEIENEAN